MRYTDTTRRFKSLSSLTYTVLQFKRFRGPVPDFLYWSERHQLTHSSESWHLLARQHYVNQHILSCTQYYCDARYIIVACKRWQAHCNHDYKDSINEAIIIWQSRIQYTIPSATTRPTSPFVCIIPPPIMCWWMRREQSLDEQTRKHEEAKRVLEERADHLMHDYRHVSALFLCCGHQRRWSGTH